LLYTYENITSFKNYDEYVNISNSNRTLKKSEILKIKNKHSLTYFCKNDICTQVNTNYLKLFVEIPDQDGNKKIYIVKTYKYNDLDLKDKSFIALAPMDLKYIYDKKNKRYSKKYTYADISFKCTSNYQCLSNKCIDGACIFNEENPIDFCAPIYKFFIFLGRHSYMHCGKTIGEPCKRNNECGSKTCLKNNICSSVRYPSDSDGLAEFIIILYTVITIMFISIISCICCCIKSIIKKIKLN
ncbi:hypothetical protein U3516DRAFT_845148, partial [Neocallimastix sp. 'constans']